MERITTTHTYPSPDALARAMESAAEYTAAGMGQLRRLKGWMRQYQITQRSSHAAVDELSARRELRRQRAAVTSFVGETAVQQDTIVTAEEAAVSTPAFPRPNLIAVPRTLQEAYPEIEDITDLTTSQILGWLGQDDYYF